jgi:hypothetical protein
MHGRWEHSSLLLFIIEASIAPVHRLSEYSAVVRYFNSLV